MPWVAAEEMKIGTQTVPARRRLPGWAQSAGPTGPVPQEHAAPAPPPAEPAPAASAEQQADAMAEYHADWRARHSWQEWWERTQQGDG